MSLKNLLILSLVCFLASCSIAQQSQKGYPTKKTVNGKAKKFYDKGMVYNMKDENANAIKEFEKALKQAPRFIDAQLQWAACHYAMGHLKEAELGFEKVLQIDSFYNKKVLYTLGLTEMKAKKYDEAAQHFQKYVDTQPKNEILLEKAKFYRGTSLLRLQALNNPVPFQPKSLGPNINTAHWEYLPSFTADQNTLIYTVRGADNQEDFYISQKKEGVFQKGVPLKVINTPKNEGAQTVSADGKLIIFTACNRKDGAGQCDLYFSEAKEGTWTKPKNMGYPINTKASEKQPSLTADGKTLFFTSNRSGGNGGFDLWVSQRKEDGKWSKPANISTTINTKKEEAMPFIHADGQTLYFASTGHPGMGKFDLFYSKKQSDNTWGEPINLGYPINTSSNDATLIVSLDGQTAYFASDRDFNLDANSKQANGPTDIYSFNLYKEARPLPVTYVKAKVTDATSGLALQSNIEIINLKDGQTITSSSTDKEGEFLICLPIGKDYALNVAQKEYLFHSENFALTNINEVDKPFILEIALQPIPVASAEIKPNAKPVILRNVFFDSGSSELRPESFTELNKLKELLATNSSLKIQINGHTDNVGSDLDNQTLSQDRAQSVFQYLVGKGIDASRIKYKGFGETKPIESNDTDLGRQSNRRTEFMVIN